MQENNAILELNINEKFSFLFYQIATCLRSIWIWTIVFDFDDLF